MTGPTLVDFPLTPLTNMPAKLRKLADEIEAGNFDDAHTLAWVMDCGNSRLEIGLMGKSESPGIEAHFLFHLGAQKIMTGALHAD